MIQRILCKVDKRYNNMVVRIIKHSTYISTKISNVLKTLFDEKYLLYTNVGISLTLSGAGDCLVQRYEIYTGDSDSWNKIRTRNMCVSGMAIGALCHYWYKFLDKRLPGHSIRIVLKKIIVDQAVCSPLCISTLFLTIGYMEGVSGKQLLEEVKEKSMKLYFAEWIVWPPAQFINFYLIPGKYRVLYDNTISLGYDIYTSYVKNTDIEAKRSTSS